MSTPIDPTRPAFLVLEQGGQWATFDATDSGRKALLIFTSPDAAAAFFRERGTGQAGAVEILAGGVPQVIASCQSNGVTEFVADPAPDIGIATGEPVAHLTRYAYTGR